MLPMRKKNFFYPVVFFMMEHNICFSRLILPVRLLKRRSVVTVYTLSMWGHTIFTTGWKCNELLTYIGFKTRIHLRFPPVQTLMFNPTDLSSREINLLYCHREKVALLVKCSPENQQFFILTFIFDSERV